MYFWNANSLATFIFFVFAGNLTVILCIPIKGFIQNKKNSSEITRMLSKKEVRTKMFKQIRNIDLQYFTQHKKK